MSTASSPFRNSLLAATKLSLRLEADRAKAGLRQIGESDSFDPAKKRLMISNCTGTMRQRTKSFDREPTGWSGD